MERLPAALAAMALVAVAFAGTAVADQDAGAFGIVSVTIDGPPSDGFTQCGGLVLAYVTVAGGHDETYAVEHEAADESAQVPGDRYYLCMNGDEDETGLWKETNGETGLQTSQGTTFDEEGQPTTFPPDTKCTDSQTDAVTCAPTAAGLP